MQNSSIARMGAILGIGLGIMVLAMLWSIVNTALASIQKDLSANILQLQWMMNAFGIFLCVPLLTMGKLGDAYGRKRLFIYGLYIALLASLIAGFASHVIILIISMALYGFSGSIILPLSQALLVHQFPESKKEKAVGIWSIFASLSLAIGPLIGGTILHFLGWRWVFLINIPAILICIPCVLLFVKKETEFHEVHCDWLGVGLLALVISSLVVAIMQGPTWGWGSYYIIGLFLLSVISLCAFLISEKKASAPLFRTDLFAQRAFLFSSIPNACMIGIIWVVFFLVPLYLQNIKGYTPVHVGLILLSVTIPVAVLSSFVSNLYSRVGARPLLLTGFALLLLALFSQAVFIVENSFWPVIIGGFLIGLGWVFVWGPSISAAISSIPHHAAGIASGMFTTMQEVGAVVFSTIAEVIFRSYDHKMLAPYMDQINLALKQFSVEQQESIITNPILVGQHLGENSTIVTWTQEAFITGYQAAFWFLFFLCLLALTLSCFLPKKDS